MIKANYHTHSTFCDGKDTIPVMVENAVTKGFDHLGFSAHAPLLKRMYDFLIREDEIPIYIKEIEEVQQKYHEITLLKGLECDFIPEENKPFQFFKISHKLDFLIGGVHLVKPPHIEELWFIDGPDRQTFDDGLSLFFGGNIEKAVTQFWEQTFEMIETESFDIIAHLDKVKMHNQRRFFTEKENWYLKLVNHALELIQQKNLILEINSRGIYKGRCPDFYPSDYILQQAARKKIPCVISADAHKGDDLGQLYQESIDKLKSFGIMELVVFGNKEWEYNPMD
jgi:histidinol-phosphatase (PHP family)